MKTGILIGLLMVLGCAERQIDPAQVATNWETTPAPDGCATILDLTPTVFVMGTKCGDSIEAISGTYSLDGDVMTMIAYAASCESPPRAYTYTVGLDADAMVLTNDSGSVMFQHAEEIKQGTFGCFINGTFMPSPLAPF